MPGEMSVTVIASTTPASHKLSEKKPVPAPISRQRAYGQSS